MNVVANLGVLHEAMALCAATVEVEYTRGLLSELSGDKYIPEAKDRSDNLRECPSCTLCWPCPATR